MKLRLFGCAAAYVLAGTLCAAAQDAPDTKMKGDGPTVGPSSGERATPDKGRAEESKGTRGESGERGNRAESKEGGGSQDKQAGDRSPDREKGKPDKAATDSGKGSKESAADKGGRKDSARSATGDEKKSDRAADSKQEADKGNKDSAKSATGDEGNRAADSKQDRDTDKRATRDQADRGEDTSKGKNVQLSSDKRDRVQSSLRSDLKLKRETKVDIDIRVGVHAPRSWAFEPMPTAVIEIVPEYRGYLVAYVEDEYVICDPNTYEIVAVLPASGGGATYASESGGSGRQCTSSLTLTESERAELLKAVEIRSEAKVSGVTIGWSVPNDIELLSFPEPVLERTSKLSGCRYFVVDDEIAIVDPQEDKVVLLVETD